MRTTVVSHEEIVAICDEMGKKISKDLSREEKLPVFVGVMKGAIPFMQELVKHVDIPFFVDYIQVSSYFGTTSSGEIRLLKDITRDLEGRTVIIVEDVVDTGLSMLYLVNHIKDTFHPKKVLVCTLFDKVAMRTVDIHIDYSGKVFKDNKFLVGFGLDYNELYRGCPEVFVPDPEEVASWDAMLAKDSGEN